LAEQPIGCWRTVRLSASARSPITRPATASMEGKMAQHARGDRCRLHGSPDSVRQLLLPPFLTTALLLSISLLAIPETALGHHSAKAPSLTRAVQTLTNRSAHRPRLARVLVSVVRHRG